MFDTVFHPKTFAGWAGLALGGTGSIVWVLGWIFMVIVAFRTSLLWGLALFIPGSIGALLFLCFNFQRAWAPFALQIFGIVLFAIGVVLCVPNAVSPE